MTHTRSHGYKLPPSKISWSRETTDKQLVLKQLRNARRCEVLDVRRQREGALSLDWADQEFFSRERNI